MFVRIVALHFCCRNKSAGRAADRIVSQVLNSLQNLLQVGRWPALPGTANTAGNDAAALFYYVEPLCSRKRKRQRPRHIRPMQFETSHHVS